jgi:hypothetical protein
MFVCGVILQGNGSEFRFFWWKRALKFRVTFL